MLYAAYGSNLHPARLRARVPSAVLLGTAALEGWSLRFHKRGRDGSAKCNIVPVAGDAVHVAVYRVDAAHRASLDEIEVGAGYRVETLQVTGFGACFAYVAGEPHIEEGLPSFSWYRALVMLGCEHFFFPLEYRERIAALAVAEDPDRSRHDAHMRIVRDARRPAPAPR